MQTVRIAAPLHETPRELVHDDDLVPPHHIVAVAVHECLCAQGGGKAVRQLDVLGRIEVLDADELFDLWHCAVGGRDGLLLLVDCVVLALLEVAHGICHDGVVVRRLCSGTRDDERGARLIDENGVHLVDDRVMQIALYHLTLREHHVVAQIVKAELVVRAERDVGGVRRLALREIHVVRDESDREPEVAVEFAHPLAVAPCEVVVDGDHVDAAPRKRVEVDRRRRDERLALACAHLGDAPLVQAYAADELDVEMPHSEHAPRRLAHDRERLGKDLLKRRAVIDLLAKPARVASQLIVREVRHRGFEPVDLIDDFAIPRDFLIIVVAKKTLQNGRYSKQVVSHS